MGEGQAKRRTQNAYQKERFRGRVKLSNVCLFVCLLLFPSTEEKNDTYETNKTVKKNIAKSME
jgi:hypothetical protein